MLGPAWSSLLFFSHSGDRHCLLSPPCILGHALVLFRFLRAWVLLTLLLVVESDSDVESSCPLEDSSELDVCGSSHLLMIAVAGHSSRTSRLVVLDTSTFFVGFGGSGTHGFWEILSACWQSMYCWAVDVLLHLHHPLIFGVDDPAAARVAAHNRLHPCHRSVLYVEWCRSFAMTRSSCRVPEKINWSGVRPSLFAAV